MRGTRPGLTSPGLTLGYGRAAGRCEEAPSEGWTAFGRAAEGLWTGVPGGIAFGRRRRNRCPRSRRGSRGWPDPPRRGRELTMDLPPAARPSVLRARLQRARRPGEQASRANSADRWSRRLQDRASEEAPAQTCSVRPRRDYRGERRGATDSREPRRRRGGRRPEIRSAGGSETRPLGPPPSTRRSAACGSIAGTGDPA